MERLEEVCAVDIELARRPKLFPRRRLHRGRLSVRDPRDDLLRNLHVKEELQRATKNAPGPSRTPRVPGVSDESSDVVSRKDQCIHCA